jgi:UDP-glucose:glycoprotein glucosyltransferase
VHALPSWLVVIDEARHDMDNLRLVDVMGDVGGDQGQCKAVYVLRQLYVEGQAFVLGEDGWPRASAKGLQIDVLGKGGQEALADTTVMGNLGYFQVRGDPGLFEVRLKPGTLSHDIFEPVRIEDVEVSSYITPPYQLRVRLKPNRSHDELFVQSNGSKTALNPSIGGWFGKSLSNIGRLLGATGGDDKVDKREEGSRAVSSDVSDGTALPTIHLFSVASGHLYEKLIGIMILSVRNKTKCPIHLWFVDQFLSPSFKEFIPLLAKEYKFDYSFVFYKWPSWLNPQTQKQRLIWAYKILFLDVLFPVDVHKIIFIDADQVFVPM